MSCLRVACLVLIAGCMPQTYRYRLNVKLDRSPDAAIVAAPSKLEPLPWRVGQWVRYGARYRDTLVVQYAWVIAVDGAGTWLEFEHTTEQWREKWTLCIRPADSPPRDPDEALRLVRAAVRERDGRPSQPIDLEQLDGDHRRALADIVWSLFPRTSFDGGRGDVDTPYAHFYQAFAVEGGWVHPAVPFDSTIKRASRDGTYERVLLRFGDDAKGKSVAAELIDESVGLDNKPLPAFALLGMTNVTLSGHGGVASSGAAAFQGLFGLRMTARLDAVLGLQAIDATDQEVYLGQAGVRWWLLRSEPARRPEYDPSSLYVQGDLAYAQLDLSSSMTPLTIGRGVAAGAALGWFPFRAGGWSLGLELDDHVMWLSRRQGVRDLYGFGTMLQIDL